MGSDHPTSTTGEDPVRAYIDGIPAAHRQTFERLKRLIDEECPDASAAISYGMLCFRAGAHRLYVGAWKHGLSMYGWPQGAETEFAARHPGLKTSKGTIRLPPETRTEVNDDELRGLVQAALSD